MTKCIFLIKNDKVSLEVKVWRMPYLAKPKRRLCFGKGVLRPPGVVLQRRRLRLRGVTARGHTEPESSYPAV